MGDMADYLTQEGESMWLDHCLGHPAIPDRCPYCEDLIDEATLMTESEGEDGC